MASKKKKTLSLTLSRPSKTQQEPPLPFEMLDHVQKYSSLRDLLNFRIVDRTKRDNVDKIIAQRYASIYPNHPQNIDVMTKAKHLLLTEYINNLVSAPLTKNRVDIVEIHIKSIVHNRTAPHVIKVERVLDAQPTDPYGKPYPENIINFMGQPNVVSVTFDNGRRDHIALEPAVIMEVITNMTSLDGITKLKYNIGTLH